MKKVKWPKPHAIPKKVWVHQNYYVKIQMVPEEDVQGHRGEWSQHEDPDNPVFGVVRISNNLTDEAKWMVFREEMSHVLIDAQRFFCVDLILLKGEENGSDA